jgi:hypothetical protein
MSAPTVFRPLLGRFIGRQRMFHDADGAQKDFARTLGRHAGARERISFRLDFLKSTLPPDRIGFMQTVNHRRKEIRESLQLDLKLGRTHTPTRVV